MFSAFITAVKTPDLRKKILYTLGIIVIYRLGSTLPSPGVNYPVIKSCLINQKSNTAVDLINMFSGGALTRLAVFAIGMTPFITASIIIQVLTVAIPRFDTLRKEGQSGQAKMSQYTRYLTVGLALLQSTALVAVASSGGLLAGCQRMIVQENKIFTMVVIVISMTTGAILAMWLGELITERGIGNGMSMLIFASVGSRIPAEGAQIWRQSKISFVLVCIATLIIIALVVFIEQAQRRIPVQYAKRMVGRRQYGGAATYLPLKVNQSGVVPVIFTSALLAVPMFIVELVSSSSDAGWKIWISKYLINQTSWIYLLVFFVLIIFFSYFYVAITFNPEERAEDMRKYGGFIPGIRPGQPTAKYLAYVLNRITFVGALYLAAIAILPNLFLLFSGGSSFQNLPLGGTSVLIIVGVGIDTVKQLESQLLQRNYEGFLK